MKRLPDPHGVDRAELAYAACILVMPPHEREHTLVVDYWPYDDEPLPPETKALNDMPDVDRIAELERAQALIVGEIGRLRRRAGLDT